MSGALRVLYLGNAEYRLLEDEVDAEYPLADMNVDGVRISREHIAHGIRLGLYE